MAQNFYNIPHFQSIFMAPILIAFHSSGACQLYTYNQLSIHCFLAEKLHTRFWSRMKWKLIHILISLWLKNYYPFKWIILCSAHLQFHKFSHLLKKPASSESHTFFGSIYMFHNLLKCQGVNFQTITLAKSWNGE